MLKLALKKCFNESWSIHGLWYDYMNGSYPQFCQNITFPVLNNNLEKEMELYWNSCENKNKEFWNHELQKHGSCIKQYVDPQLTSEEYFNITTLLFISLEPFIPYLCDKINQCFINLLPNIKKIKKLIIINE